MTLRLTKMQIDALANLRDVSYAFVDAPIRCRRTARELLDMNLVKRTTPEVMALPLYSLTVAGRRTLNQHEEDAA